MFDIRAYDKICPISRSRSATYFALSFKLLQMFIVEKKKVLQKGSYSIFMLILHVKTTLRAACYIPESFFSIWYPKGIPSINNLILEEETRARIKNDLIIKLYDSSREKKYQRELTWLSHNEKRT